MSRLSIWRRRDDCKEMPPLNWRNGAEQHTNGVIEGHLGTVAFLDELSMHIHTRHARARRHKYKYQAEQRPRLVVWRNWSDR